MVVLSQTSDDTIEQFLGLHRKQDFQPSEREYPELLAFVWPKNIQPPPHINLAFERPSDQVLLSGEWKGTANRLSKDDPIRWDIIDEVADASGKSTQEAEIIAYASTSETPNPQVEKESEPLAGQIIHQRRSAVSFDGHTSLSVDRFYTMLLRTMPQSELPVPARPMPWDALPWNPTVHLALFVHRVDGLPSGMYWLNRNPHGRPMTDFQSDMQEQFVWTTPGNCPPQLPLYLLEEGDAKNLAMQLSCGQEIAKDSAFALGMVAEFDESLEKYGPWFYKRLFWEPDSSAKCSTWKPRQLGFVPPVLAASLTIPCIACSGFFLRPSGNRSITLPSAAPQMTGASPLSPPTAISVLDFSSPLEGA